MINNVNLGALTSSETASLVSRVANRVDGNKDGSISKSEFSQFLTDLLGKLGGGPSDGALALSSTLSSKTSSSTFPGVTSASLPPCPIGWNPEKWANESHQTPKYVVGRVLSQYPPTPAGLKQALTNVQAAIPGTTLIGDDKLQIPGVGTIDVGVSFGSGGGVGWCWRVTD